MLVSYLCMATATAVQLVSTNVQTIFGPGPLLNSKQDTIL